MSERDPGPGIPVAALLGAEIRAERARQGWTQAALAERVGVEQRTISRWETGQARIRMEDFVSVALALSVSPGTLLDAALAR